MAVVPPSQTAQASPYAGHAVAAEMMAKEAILTWFRGEFAAANAIIDALCGYLAQLSDGGSEYANVFAAIHRRRLNWIPVLQMQKYQSIAGVTMELRNVSATKKVEKEEIMSGKEIVELTKEVEKIESRSDETKDGELKFENKVVENNENSTVDDVLEDHDTTESEVTDTGSLGLQPASENVDICDNHEDCESRPSQIKLTKGFSAKEPIKGRMVNVVKGLKLYENIFTSSELSKLNHFVDDLRSAGQNGELSGGTYILFNQQVKGNRRELIQLGVPIFRQMKEEEGCNGLTTNIDPIPPLLESLIDHLVRWHLIPEYKRPNGCIISFFKEEEHSQPFQKPPHLDHPVSSLFLSKSTMVFGHSLVGDNDGNYKGSLTLSLKEGSLLVMRGNSADTARHAICPTPNRRVSITFFRLRPDSFNECQSPKNSPPASAVTQWQPSHPIGGYTLVDGAPNAYEPVALMPEWGVLHAPVVMLTPIPPMVTSPSKLPPGGTGVFLPWTNGSRRHKKHSPPRAQKGRLLALSAPESLPSQG